MATRTIAPGGGNWNSNSTWVEGAVPSSGDLILGLSTSGNLTINVNPSFQYVMDMTNYAATMSIATSTFAMPSTITTPALTISTFSSAMTITYSAVSNICQRNQGSANTWAFLGNGPYGEWPTMNIGAVSNVLTITGILRMNTLTRTNTNTTINKGITGGTMSLSRYIGFNGGGALLEGTCPLVFDRTSGEWSNSTNYFAGFVSNPIIINTSATFSITPQPGYSYGFLGVRANGSLTYISGTISNTNKNLWISNQINSTTTQVNQTATLDVSSAGTWSSIHIHDAHYGTYNSNSANTISLSSDLYFNELRIQPNNGNGQYLGGNTSYRIITRFSGAGKLRGGYLIGQTYFNSRGEIQAPTIPNFDGITYFTPRVQLATGTPSNHFKGIKMYGIPDPSFTGLGLSASYCQLSSASPGTLSYIDVDEATSFGVSYTDIDASSGVAIKNYFGTSSNSTNITNIASLPSGGGETSATFVS